MDISFCDLRQKEVVNIFDGKRLGRVIDIVISLHSCRVLGIVVPGNRKLFNTKEDIFVPWKNIHKSGDDVVLVQLTASGGPSTDYSRSSKKICKVTPVTYSDADEGAYECEDFSPDDE